MVLSPFPTRSSPSGSCPLSRRIRVPGGVAGPSRRRTTTWPPSPPPPPPPSSSRTNLGGLLAEATPTRRRRRRRRGRERRQQQEESFGEEEEGLPRRRPKMVTASSSSSSSSSFLLADLPSRVSSVRCRSSPTRCPTRCPTRRRHPPATPGSVFSSSSVVFMSTKVSPSRHCHDRNHDPDLPPPLFPFSTHPPCFFFFFFLPLPE